jgi:hypothetical protein
MARDTEVGSVTVGVVPDATGIEQKLKDQIVPAAERVGEEAGNEMSNAIEDKMTEGGDKSASKFEKSFKTRLKKALDNLPDAKIEGDVTDVEQKIEEVRAEIQSVYAQPLIDKADAARSIDQIMLKVAALRAEAASGIDIPVDVDTQGMLADFETAITKIRGKAITGALVPGGMFSRIPFSGSAADKVLAAAQQQAAASAMPSMSDIFVEAKALQFARDQAVRRPSFANIPLGMNEIVQDVTSMGPARAKMFEAGAGGLPGVIQGVIREAMPSSPYGGASFVAAVDGIQKATFSMSKEIELLRKPVGDIVRSSDNMATSTEGFGRLLREIAPNPTFGFGTRDLGGRRVWAGRSAERAFRGMGVPEGLLHEPGLGGYLGGARFAAGPDAISDFSNQFSKDLVKFEKPMGDIVKYTANLNGTGQELVRMSDFIRQSDFSNLVTGDTFFKKMADAVARGFRSGQQGVLGRLRGIVSRRGAGAGAPLDTGIPEDVVSSIEARLKSGVPITGELGKFAQFLKSDAARALGTPGPVTPEIIDAIEKRLTTGVPLTGELNKFARYIKLDAALGVRRSLEELIPRYGAGGGDVQKLLGEFGGGHRPAATETLLKAFGAGGGDLEKLLADFGGDIGGAGGGGGGGGFFSKISDFFGKIPGAGSGLLGKVPFAGGNAYAGAGIGGGVLASLPFIGQMLSGGAVAGLGTGLATMGIAGAIHGLSSAATPAQISAARMQSQSTTLATADAQSKLNALMKSGTATAAQLAQGHLAVAAAQTNQAAASSALADLIANKITPAQQAMSDAFKTFGDDFGKSMTTIGAAFVPVLTNIAKVADQVLHVMTPVFAVAEQIIAPAVQNIGGTLLKAFAQPAVQQSITAVAKAFADLLNAMSPNIVSGIGAIANSITNMADSVAKNPRPFADFIKFLFGVVNAAIQAVAWLTRVADWIESFHTFWAAIGKGFDEVIHNIKTVWNWLAHFHDFWKLVWATAQTYFDNFVAGIKIDFKVIGTVFHVASDVIHGNFGNIWTDIKNGAKSIVPVISDTAKQITQHFTHPQNAIKQTTQHLKHTADGAKQATQHLKHATVTATTYRHSISTQHIARPVADAVTTYRHSIATQPIARPVAARGETGWAGIRHDTAHLGDMIAAPFISMWHGMASITDAGMKGIGKVIHFGLASFNNWWKQHGTEVKEVWRALWTAIKNTFMPIIHFVQISIRVGLDVIKFAFRAIALVVRVQWTLMWNGVKGVAKAAVDILKGIIHAALKFIQIMWNLGWNIIKDTLKVAWDIIVGIINVALDIFTGHWKQAWDDIKTAVTQVWNSFKDIFKTAWKTLTDAVGVAFGLLKTVFVTGGGDIIHGLFSGITGALKDIGSWISTNIYHPIIDHVKSLFGIKSPASTMKPIGKEIITGIFHGMFSEGKKIEQFAAKIFGSWPKAILSFVTKGMVGGMTAKLASFLGGALGWATKGIKNIGGFFGSIFSAASGSHGGAGVARWAGTVGKALTMLNLPQNLAGDVLYQMQTESSGNPNIINTWDSNARAGHPSQGLMQVIPSTFGQYHVAGTSWNILDPLANIAAALNYAKHNKGFGSGKGQIGSGHGYDTGGWLPTGVTMTMNNTGRPERILSPDELKAFNAGQGPTYVAHFDGLTSQAISAEVRTAFHMMSLTQGQLGRPGRRN